MSDVDAIAVFPDEWTEQQQAEITKILNEVFSNEKWYWHIKENS